MKVYIKGTLSQNEIAEITGGELINPNGINVSVITTDSREAGDGAMFVAIKGERVDGNDYILSAAENGAVCALAQRIPDCFSNSEYKGVKIPVIVVSDVKNALGMLAKAYKDRINPLTVAITGSVGKTTTKEFIYSVLSEKYKTYKTEGNYNSDIGLPITLLGLSPENDAAVLEMGMSAKGEIDFMSRVATPKIAVVTNIGTSHIGLLGSRQAIRDAKLEIKNGMKKNGVLILNGDEPLLEGIKGAFYVSGKNEKANLYFSNITEGDNGCAFDITMNGEKYESIIIPSLGEHNVMNASYAFAVGVFAGLGEFEIRQGLMKFKNAKMRQQTFEKDGVTLLEDCYNAAPESMAASLKVLSDMGRRKASRCVAVLGDMRELGEHSKACHEKVGAAVVTYGVDILITVGDEAENIAKSALRFGMERECVFTVKGNDYIADTSKLLEKLIKKNDIVLFKASRALMLEKVVEYIKG